MPGPDHVIMLSVGPGQLAFDGFATIPPKPPADDAGPQAVQRSGSAAKSVEAFHRAFGLPSRRKPSPLIAAEERDLRIRLAREETEEFATAAERGDLAAIADALADIVYVAYGTALHYGFDLDTAIAEVHRSNMSKLGPDGVALMRPDGKVLKGPSYSPPDLIQALGLPSVPSPAEPTGPEPLPGFRVYLVREEADPAPRSPDQSGSTSDTD